MKKRLYLYFFILPAILVMSCVITATTNLSPSVSPPRVEVRDNPDLVIIPGTYVYYLQYGDGDVFFYNGSWYRSWNNNWYQSDNYRGSWSNVDDRHVPNAVTQLPPRWHDRMNDAPHVTWNETDRNWHQWEQDRYWERRNWRKDANPQDHR